MQPTMTIPRFQRKRSYDELAWSRREHVRATESDSDDFSGYESGSTVHYGRSSAPPTKLRCNCAHVGVAPAEPSPTEVFLGGSCGGNMWRRDITIPGLLDAGVSFYNPQLEPGAWHSGLISVEAEAKRNAAVLMFVVDGATRGLASMIEVAAAVSSGRTVVLCVEHVPEGAVIAGDEVTENERKDLNRAREYLVSVAEERIKEGHNNIELCSTVSEATTHAARLAKALRNSCDYPESCAGSCQDTES